MNTWAFVLACVAGALGLIDFLAGDYRGRVTGLALAVLAAALVVAFTVHSGGTVTF